ncbi:hypothetical protein [Pseudogemmobacter sp. W21_MBD1_M6]|uniref:hypothetical protein n=1 Tax=Pseudogemmobacter sp. W21_MBD1_M6 TaxID=3240271 RepID=UPI003F9E066E
MQRHRVFGAVPRDLRGSARTRLAATLFAAVFLAGPAQAVDRLGRIVVVDDRGGNVLDRMQQIERLRASRQVVEIRAGYCVSACTLYLGLDRTCVAPDAQFGFHGPSSGSYGIALPTADFEHWSRLIATYYPEPLRRWYLQTGRTVTVGFFAISGLELIHMGVTECPA